MAVWLYAHFVTFVNKNKNIWLGQMGTHPKPNVGEFNTDLSKESDLRKILESGSHPAFIYFYPGLKGMDEVLKDYC